ncbi:MAG: phage holin family protein [Candidatus Falkowbacteria bacterium]|nr:phage holin family protein [Candidatus Falkowbacteria bacterium]
MNLIIRWLLATIAIIITSYILPGVVLSGFWTAVLVALVIGIINAVIKPILLILTLPINILSLGLFTLVINALLILLSSKIVDGFSVASFWTALLFSIILSIISFFLGKLAPSKK